MILDQSAASSYSALSRLRSHLSTTFSPDKPGFLLISHRVEGTPWCFTDLGMAPSDVELLGGGGGGASVGRPFSFELL